MCEVRESTEGTVRRFYDSDMTNFLSLKFTRNGGRPRLLPEYFYFTLGGVDTRYLGLDGSSRHNGRKIRLPTWHPVTNVHGRPDLPVTRSTDRSPRRTIV